MKHPPDLIRMTLKRPLLPMLALTCLVMHILDVTALWQALFFIFGGLWLICWLWARSLANGLVIQRLMRYGWAQVGDRLEERFVIDNRGWAPALWVAVEDGSDLPGHPPGWVTGVNGRSKTEWRLTTECIRRGLYKLGPIDLVSGDPFGVFEVKRRDPTSQTLLITPPVVALPGVRVAMGGWSGDGQLHPHALERSVSAASVREYTPGDNLHLIHWPTSVRRQELFIRLFDTTQTGDWRILLDLHEGVQFGLEPEDTIEHGVILAASLVDLAFESRWPVGLALNGDELTWLSPRFGEDQRWDIMRALALAQPGRFSLLELLERLSGQIHNRGSLVLITADTSLDWLPALIKLTWRGVTPTILLIDGLEFKTETQIYTLPAVESAARLLTQQGISNHIIPRTMLKIPESRSGKAGAWEWKASPRGRAVAVRRPNDLSWRNLW